MLVIDIAHGHSQRDGARRSRELRKRFGDVELIAGNVATAEGARFLLERGVNGIKVGIGPGGGCTTRMTTSFGVPQVQALVECRLAVNAAGSDVPLIADGGIQRHGALAMALMFGGDCAMLGSAFAGTEETPGEVVHKSVVLPESQKTVKVPFKVLRGMASLEAIRDRLDVEDADQRRGRGDRRRGHGDQRARARLGADDRPRHDQAPVLVDQLRRRRQPARAARALLARAGSLPDQAVGVVAARVVRPLTRSFRAHESASSCPDSRRRRCASVGAPALASVPRQLSSAVRRSSVPLAPPRVGKPNP